MDRTKLLNFWAEHYRWIGGKPHAEQLGERVLAGWEGPGRAYHTTQHLGECMDLLTRWGFHSRAKHEVGVALWFHDFVYETTSPDNEDRSIGAMREMLGAEGIKPDVVERIARLIEVTKHSSAAPMNDAERLLVDIDLAILGAAPARFVEYCEQVRQEFSWVPEETYRARRAEFLESMLARPQIFTLEVALMGREAAARKNVAAEAIRQRSGA